MNCRNLPRQNIAQVIPPPSHPPVGYHNESIHMCRVKKSDQIFSWDISRECCSTFSCFVCRPLVGTSWQRAQSRTWTQSSWLLVVPWQWHPWEVGNSNSCGCFFFQKGGIHRWPVTSQREQRNVPPQVTRKPLQMRDSSHKRSAPRSLHNEPVGGWSVGGQWVVGRWSVGGREVVSGWSVGGR